LGFPRGLHSPQSFFSYMHPSSLIYATNQRIGSLLLGILLQSISLLTVFNITFTPFAIQLIIVKLCLKGYLFLCTQGVKDTPTYPNTLCLILSIPTSFYLKLIHCNKKSHLGPILILLQSVLPALSLYLQAFGYLPYFQLSIHCILRPCTVASSLPPAYNDPL
jgi:hypothetical protein